MASRLPTFSMLLLVFLLSLFTTKTVAHNRFQIPSSCIGNPSMLKCALDFRATLEADASFGVHIASSELNVLLDLINATKIAGVSIQNFLPNLHSSLINAHPKIELINKFNSNINIAVQELIKAYAVIQGETKITLVELHKVEKCLKIASKVATKLNVCAGSKHANSNPSILLNNLINQFVSLTNLSLKIIGTIEANGKVSL